MKLRLYLLICTLLVLSTTGYFLRGQQASVKWYALVGGVRGKWRFVGTLPEDLRSPSQRKEPYLHSFDAFVLDVNSCAAGAGDSLVVLINDEAYTYVCDRAKDPPCQLPPNQKEFTCIRHIVPKVPGTQTPAAPEEASSEKPGSRKNRHIVPKVPSTQTPAAPKEASSEKAGFWGNLIAAAAPLFANDPPRYVTPVARGLEAELADGVAELQGDRVDLAPAFQGVDPGTYRLRLESLSGQGASTPVQLQWSGTGPASIPASGMQPGLYRLVRLTPNGEPTGLDAWLLVRNPERFARDSAAFQSAVEATKNWPDDVDARAPRTLLRAYLDSLSRQVQTGH